jgi:hypothetical protein
MLALYSLMLFLFVLPMMALSQSVSSSSDIPDAPVPNTVSVNTSAMATHSPLTFELPTKRFRIEQVAYRDSQLAVIAGLVTDMRYRTMLMDDPRFQTNSWTTKYLRLDPRSKPETIAVQAGIDGVVLYGSHLLKKRGEKAGLLGTTANFVKGALHFRNVQQETALLH